jgi:hypothetical protein
VLKNMNRFAIGFGLIAACAAAVPASAVVVVDPSAKTLLDTSAGTAAGSFTVRYFGYFDGVQQLGLVSDVTFTLNSVQNLGRRWNFTASISNRTLSTFSASTINLLGFATDDDLATSGLQFATLNSASVSGGGVFTSTQVSNTGFTVPNLSSTQQFCLKTGGLNGECETSGAAGVSKGSTVSQSFALNFATSESFVSLQNFVMSFRGVTGTAIGSGGPVSVENADVTGFGTIAAAAGPIPEPSSWAMLIAGFGLIGAAMRRRRHAVA